MKTFYKRHLSRFFSRTVLKQFPLITNDQVNFWLTVDDKADTLALNVLGHFANLVFHQPAIMSLL